MPAGFLSLAAGAWLLAVFVLSAAPSKVLVFDRVYPELTGVRDVDTVQGELAVLTTTDHAVRWLSSGRETRRIGSIGNGPGELYQPTGLDVGPDGTLWVVDRGNGRVQAFRPDGSPLGAYPASRASQALALPRQQAAIVESFDESLATIIDARGQVVRKISAPANEPISGATPRQTIYLNKPRVALMRDGALVSASVNLLKPVVRLIETDSGQVRWTARPWSDAAFSTLVAAAAARQQEIVKTGGYGGRQIVGSLQTHPLTGEIWLGTGATSILVLSPVDGRIVQEYHLETNDKNKLGVHDIEFLADGRLLVVAGGTCWLERPNQRK